MICKIQMSLFTSDGTAKVLIYNKSRTVMYEATGEEAKEVIKKYGMSKTKNKIYVKATNTNGILNLKDVTTGTF